MQTGIFLFLNKRRFNNLKQNIHILFFFAENKCCHFKQNDKPVKKGETKKRSKNNKIVMKNEM